MILEPINDQFLEDVPDLELNGEKTDTFLVGTKGSCEEDSCFTSENLKKDNYLSEFKYEYQKARVRKNLGISSQETLRWGNISGYIEEQKDLQGKFEEINSKIADDIEGMLTKKVDKEDALTQIKYINDAYPNIKTLSDALDQVLYFDLKISPFSASPNSSIYGNTISEVQYTWGYNKNIKSQYLMISGNKIDLDPDVRSYKLKKDIESNYSITLHANDGVKNYSGTSSITFKYYLYYGTAESFNTVTNFKKVEITALPTSSYTISECDQNEYWFVCIPKNILKTPNSLIFVIGGLEYTLEYEEKGINTVNDHIEQYYVFRSSKTGQTPTFKFKT